MTHHVGERVTPNGMPFPGKPHRTDHSRNMYQLIVILESLKLAKDKLVIKYRVMSNDYVIFHKIEYT